MEATVTNRSANEFNGAKSGMDGDFRTIITEGEELLKAAATVSGESFTAARTKFAEKLSGVKARLADASQPIINRTKQTAAMADDYVHGNPWSTLGIGIAVGALIGFLIAKR